MNIYVYRKLSRIDAVFRLLSMQSVIADKNIKINVLERDLDANISESASRAEAAYAIPLCSDTMLTVLQRERFQESITNRRSTPERPHWGHRKRKGVYRPAWRSGGWKCQAGRENPETATTSGRQPGADVQVSELETLDLIMHLSYLVTNKSSRNMMWGILWAFSILLT